LKLDAIDISILDAFLNDGRASLREVARETSLSTPTVSSHLSRLMKGRLIKKFIPLLNLDAIDQGIVSVVTLKVPPSEVNTMAKKLAGSEEVAGVYVTSGEHRIILKVHAESVHELEHFLSETVANRGCVVVASEILSSIVKDEQPVKLKSGVTLALKCDFCKGPISNNRPYNIKVGNSRYYFCCKTCRRTYLDKHRSRLEAAKSRATLSKIH